MCINVYVYIYIYIYIYTYINVTRTMYVVHALYYINILKITIILVIAI